MKIMKTSLAIAALLCTLGFGQAGACTLLTVAEIPVTMVGGLPMAQVRVNDRLGHLLVSGGTDYSLVRPGTADRLGLERAIPAVLEQVADQPYARADTVQLGDRLYSQVGFVISGAFVPARIDGVLGRNVLNNADTEYDLGGGKVRLIRSRGCVARQLAYWDKDRPFSVLKMSHDSAVRPSDLADVWVNGVRLTALLDSGAGPSAITREGARLAGLDVGDEPTVAAPEVRLDQERVTRTRLRLIDRPGADYDMILGSDFFASHRVYIARTQGRVYLTYNGGPVFAQ